MLMEDHCLHTRSWKNDLLTCSVTETPRREMPEDPQQCPGESGPGGAAEDLSLIQIQTPAPKTVEEN